VLVVLAVLVLALSRVQSTGAPIAPSPSDSDDTSTNSCHTPSGVVWPMLNSGHA
jgi:hypothetical protein